VYSITGCWFYTMRPSVQMGTNPWKLKIESLMNGTVITDRSSSVRSENGRRELSKVILSLKRVK